jgi:pimeloyl-ACP methyl ester carboxylesterase
VIEGRGDRMCPPSITRAWAKRAGSRYVELDGGHFAMLTRGDEATQAITSWLRRASASGPDRARADTARP